MVKTLDVRVPEQSLAGEGLVVGHVACEHDQHEVLLPGHVVALLHACVPEHPLLEAVDVGEGLAIEIDPDQAGEGGSTASGAMARSPRR